MWIQIADLPPRKCLGKIFFSSVIQRNHIRIGMSWYPAELLSCLRVLSRDLRENRSSFKLKLLVANLGAKNHMLKRFKFNSFYGFHYCSAPCKTIGKTRLLSVFKSGDVREPSDNYLCWVCPTAACRKFSECSGRERKKCSCGSN